VTIDAKRPIAGIQEDLRSHIGRYLEGQPIRGAANRKRAL
jgi:hypothetical protein